MGIASSVLEPLFNMDQEFQWCVCVCVCNKHLSNDKKDRGKKLKAKVTLLVQLSS